MITSFQNRVSQFPVNEEILSRWSPRAFVPNQVIAEQEIMSMVEAGKWAQSSSNSQPWHYVICNCNSPLFTNFLSCLDESNAEWCKNASALICLTVEKTDGKGANKFDFFSCGLSAQNVTTQAMSLGYHTHFMAGFNEEKLRTFLNLSEEKTVVVCFVVGKMGNSELLTERNQSRELPSLRKPITDIVTII
jgi:nitroreductase